MLPPLATHINLELERISSTSMSTQHRAFPVLKSMQTIGARWMTELKGVNDNGLVHRFLESKESDYWFFLSCHSICLTNSYPIKILDGNTDGHRLRNECWELWKSSSGPWVWSEHWRCGRGTEGVLKASRQLGLDCRVLETHRLI